MKLLKDILSNKSADGKRTFSQGRFYLFVSFVAFFIVTATLFALSFYSDISTDNARMNVVVDNMKWALGTFALYVLGNNVGRRAFSGRFRSYGGGGNHNDYGDDVDDIDGDFDDYEGDSN